MAILSRRLNMAKIRNYKVKINLECEWGGISPADVRKQIDEEWGGFGDIKNDISIELFKDDTEVKQ